MADPIDPDLAAAPPRPAHHHLDLVLLVVVGGFAGTWVRAAIEDAVPPSAGGWPWATLTVNLTGAFTLGLLLEVLARTGPDTGRRRRWRITLGTGVLGGYTTYSTLAVEVTQLGGHGAALTGAAYAMTSLVLGPAAAAVGYRLARLVRPTPPPRTPR